MNDDLTTTGKQLEEKSLDAKQALKYAEDLSKLYVSLKRSERRYRALFEYSPISLWEEDLSQVKKYIDGLRERGTQDFKKYFEENPKEIDHCSDLIKILDVNQSTLKLYEAESKEKLSENLNKILGERAHEILGKQLLFLAEGTAFEFQCVNRTLAGKEITVLMKASIPPGYEETWSMVLISVHDLSERIRADFLKHMFGRYLSEEVTNALLENPDLVKLGGEKRGVTIMMSDLRGFTAIAERLDPDRVVRLLNTYFEIMVEVLSKYSGTIIEFIGDAMLAIFGAPHEMPERAMKSIACAIAMQNAMTQVNQENRAQGLPELEMGIGLNEAEVVVGNIGSSKRSKYAVVGSGVNMASRIESYTVGGQILVSESVRKKVGDIVRIDGQREVIPKGSEVSIKIFEIGGIGPPYNLALEKKDPEMFTLFRHLPVRYTVIGGKDVGKVRLKGSISGLSKKSAEVEMERALDILSNIMMNLEDVSEDLASKDFYGKVIKSTGKDKKQYIVRFTSAPPEVAAYFQALQKYASKG